jgi:hypothetical protein
VQAQLESWSMLQRGFPLFTATWSRKSRSASYEQRFTMDILTRHCVVVYGMAMLV